MSKFTIKATNKFLDAEHGNALVKKGELIETESFARVKRIIKLGVGQLVKAEHGKKGKRIMFHQTTLASIGGIETADKQIIQVFGDKNLCFVFREADQIQLLEIAKTCDIIIDERANTYEADVLIMMYYNSNKLILNRVKARKVYHIIHADFETLAQYPQWKDYKFKQDERVDKIIAVSKTVQAALKKRFGVESTVVRNILNPNDNHRMVFLALTRATEEKGIEQLCEFANKAEEMGKDFVIFLCSNIQSDRLNNQSRIVKIPPSIYNQELMRAADYLIQLSSSESYCYSVREALQVKLPVICSDIPELKKLVKPGENGYILGDEITDDDIDKIFNEVPKPKAYIEKIDSNWSKLIKGEL